MSIPDWITFAGHAIIILMLAVSSRLALRTIKELRQTCARIDQLEAKLKALSLEDSDIL